MWLFGVVIESPDWEPYLKNLKVSPKHWVVFFTKILDFWTF